MASERATVDHIVDRLVEGGAASARSRAMFGEYAVYYDDKVVALVCDDRLFVKITPGTSDVVHDDTETAPPYPSAKDHFVIDESSWDDADYLASLAFRAAADLPRPRPRPRTSRKSP